MTAKVWQSDQECIISFIILICSGFVVQQRYPEDKVVLFFLFLADIANTILREATSIAAEMLTAASPDATMVHKRNAGLATASFYGVIALMLIITSIILMVIYRKPFKIALLLAQTLAALLYFYGDNINYLTQNYGEELGCGSTCRENNRIAAVILLGLALLIYFFLPQVIGELAEMCKWKSEHTGWYHALNMISVIIKIDALYTAIAIKPPTDEFCGKTDLSLSIAFIILSSIAGVTGVVVYGISTCKLYDFKNENKARSIVGIAVVMLFVCTIIYILADNHQPLGCAFGCDSQAANYTVNNCNVIGNSGTRLGLMLFTLLIAVSAGVLMCCGNFKDPEVTAKPL